MILKILFFGFPCIFKNFGRGAPLFFRISVFSSVFSYRPHKPKLGVRAETGPGSGQGLGRSLCQRSGQEKGQGLSLDQGGNWAEA